MNGNGRASGTVCSCLFTLTNRAAATVRRDELSVDGPVASASVERRQIEIYASLHCANEGFRRSEGVVAERRGHSTFDRHTLSRHSVFGRSPSAGKTNKWPLEWSQVATVEGTTV